MNCPRCGATGFLQSCRNCALLTPRAIEEVRKALASLRGRGNGNPIAALLRHELELQGVLSGDDIATVLRLSQSRSLAAADTRRVEHQADAVGSSGSGRFLAVRASP